MSEVGDVCTDPPQRVQLSRRKGWRKPENTVVVARPSRWGNPFRLVPDGAGWFVDIEGRASDTRAEKSEAASFAGNLFRACLEYDWDRYPPLKTIREELQGKNLACWTSPAMRTCCSKSQTGDCSSP